MIHCRPAPGNATIRPATLMRAKQAIASRNEVSMTNPLMGLWPPTTVHNTRHEGIRLGLIVGTVTWLWVALIDVVTGRPWHTFSMLGGVLVFTVMHYLLNVMYGMVLVSAVHGAERAPSLIIAVLFGVLTLEGAFGMFTNIVVEYSVGNVAWVGIVGGSLLGTAVAISLLSRTHPLLAHLRRAEEEM
jgi:hypothetical protein